MPDQAEIDKAAEILRRGGLVAFATETVYGLGADATNPTAVAKIFSVKGRPPTNPLIVHVADLSIAKEFVRAWPESAQRLAQSFWPGPLTFVLPKAESIVPAVTAGLPTVAIRCPAHPVALDLLRKFAGPVAAPSANRSNRVSPTTAEHVRRDLANDVDLILDGGPCHVGIESTVIDLTTDRPAILRPGAITLAQLQQIVGPIASPPATDPSAPTASPGQLPVHYAPRTPAFRFDRADLPHLQNLFITRLGRSPLFLLIHGTELARDVRLWADSGKIIEMPASAEDYARRLYAAFHEADDRRPDVIWVQQPPDQPQWDALADRIHRATRPASDCPDL
jgi:L-threonylcarbamoyladenylate synthase